MADDYEERLRAIDEQLARRQQAAGEVGRGADIEGIAAGLGGGYEGMLGHIRARKRAAEALGGVAGKVNPGATYEAWNREATGITTDLRSQLANEITGLQQQRQGLLGEQLQGQRSALMSREDQMRQDLLGQIAGYGQMVRGNLQGQLGDIAEQAGEARQGLGAGLAERGLSRSTFGTRAMEDVNQAELGQKAEARAGAAQAQEGAQRIGEEAVSHIDRIREKIKTAKTIEELRVAQGEQDAFDSQRLKQNFELGLQNMKMDADSRASFGKIAGGIASAVGGIFGKMVGLG